jgi:hypothetical protein
MKIVQLSPFEESFLPLVLQPGQSKSLINKNPKTIQTHIQHICDKFEVENRLDLCIKFWRGDFDDYQVFCSATGRGGPAKGIRLSLGGKSFKEN